MARQPTQFGSQVRALRRAVGLTQAELAEASGISERTVSDLERGVRATVYPATARALAAALRVRDDRLTAFLLAAGGAEGPSAGVIGMLDPLPATYRSRLPARPARLIGRDSEVASILALVRNPGIHLVTVLGPGGVGKTRLVTEVAVMSQDEFAAGTWFIDLALVDDVALVLPAIASGIGLQPEPGELSPLLASRIGSGTALLVLDTFGHLLPAGPGVAGVAPRPPGAVSQGRFVTHDRAAHRATPASARPVGAPLAGGRAGPGGGVAATRRSGRSDSRTHPVPMMPVSTSAAENTMTWAISRSRRVAATGSSDWPVT